MIPEAELRRQAFRWQVDPMILDLDYALGWFLAGLFGVPKMSQSLCFKGGTCLRKCYFPDYRFSEDLDFTSLAVTHPESLIGWVEQVIFWSEEKGGPNFRADPYRLEVLEDEYGKESFQLRVYYRGPLAWGGSPRSIRIDITRDELFSFPTIARPLIHPYSDAPVFGNLPLWCYSLEEILAEKLRALGGQRRFAIARDLYDVYRLSQVDVRVEEVLRALPDKFAARGVELAALDIDHLTARRAEFEQDWQRRLSYLMPDHEAVDFDQAWQSTIRLLNRAGRA